jgi:hypothetical protein
MTGNVILCSGEPALDLKPFTLGFGILEEVAGEPITAAAGFSDAPRQIPLAQLASMLDEPAENRFIFFYDSPAASLLALLHDGIDAAALAGYLKNWEESNTQLLQHYLLNQDRCLLVNYQMARSNPEAYRAVVMERWGIAARHLVVDQQAAILIQQVMLQQLGIRFFPIFQITGQRRCIDTVVQKREQTGGGGIVEKYESIFCRLIEHRCQLCQRNLPWSIRKTSSRGYWLTRHLFQDAKSKRKRLQIECRFTTTQNHVASHCSTTTLNIVVVSLPEGSGIPDFSFDLPQTQPLVKKITASDAFAKVEQQLDQFVEFIIFV